MGLLLLSLAHADECDRVPLMMRQTVPMTGSAEVPLNARLVFATIGYGTEDEWTLELRVEGAPVETSSRSWCYDHEGPDEVHCWHVLDPVEDLAPTTEYALVAKTTETWSGEDGLEQTSRFTTNEELLESPFSGTLSAEIGERWNQYGGLDCSWPVTRRYWLTARNHQDESGLGLLHFYRVYDDAEPELVHTLFLTAEATEGLVKQFLDATTNPSDCFFLVQEDGTGAMSEPSETFCWEPPVDTAVDSEPVDSEAPVDSEEPSETDEPRDRREPYTPEGCGCTVVPIPGLGLALAATLLLRRRGRLACDDARDGEPR